MIAAFGLELEIFQRPPVYVVWHAGMGSETLQLRMSSRFAEVVHGGHDGNKWVADMCPCECCQFLQDKAPGSIVRVLFVRASANQT
jgi:hypothetical protein